jgi:hypothetical protein
MYCASKEARLRKRLAGKETGARSLANITKTVMEEHGQDAAAAVAAAKEAVPEIEETEELDLAVQREAVDEIRKAAFGFTRTHARMKMLKVPEGLKGDAAEQWADARMVELLPLAVADIEYDLIAGSPDQRAKARQQVLDATGRSKREAAAGTTAPIVMLVGSVAQVPWAQSALCRVKMRRPLRLPAL